MNRMGRIMVTFLIAGVLAVAVLYLYRLSENRVSLVLGSTLASVQIEHDTLTLGIVKYGEKRELSFRIHNTGDAPLLVGDVRPSCGCTGVKWSKRPVHPGHIAEIKIVFEPNSLGRFMKSIDVWCNTPQHIHKLHLRGEVVE